MYLNWTPTQNLTPKIASFIFLIGHIWMRCHQISSIAVCVEQTEFLDNIFKLPIFKPKFNFLEILKANMKVIIHQSTGHHFSFHWCPLPMLPSKWLRSGYYCAVYSVIVQCNACTSHSLFVWLRIMSKTNKKIYLERWLDPL